MQKDKQERYLELLAGLRLMDDDFFSEALDEKIAPVEYILNTVLERDDIRVFGQRRRWNIKVQQIARSSWTFGQWTPKAA